MEIQGDLEQDIIQWDIKTWAKALKYWETETDWSNKALALEL